MSEKITDSIMLNIYKDIFGHLYHTESNKELFENKLPDGWDIINDYLIIIENKKILKKSIYKNAKEQILNYYNNIPNKERFKDAYLILGFGNNEESFKYYIINNNELTKYTLKDIYDIIYSKTKNDRFLIDEKQIHNINTIIYNSIDIQKQQKTLFIASILICLKIDKHIFNNNEKIANKIVNTINDYYSDIAFTNNFRFIKKLNKDKEILEIIHKISEIIKTYDGDLLNKFYHEFCQWDKNDDTKFGIVLTPSDIVELMVKELNIQENDKVLDFCTGTGSFLIECGKYYKNTYNKNIKLYGCECSDERYSLAKCNFILNNFDYSKLYYSSCFNVNYKSNHFDKIIINPPFGKDCTDIDNSNNYYNWKNYSNEQKFVIYALELLKPGGRCVAIIPRNNFAINNNKNKDFKETIFKHCKIIKIINCNSKVFYPVASVECSIIVFEKLSKENNEQQNILTVDYTQDGYKTFKNKRIKYCDPVYTKLYKDINNADEWNYEKDSDSLKLTVEEFNKKFALYYASYDYAIKQLYINSVDITDYSKIFNHNIYNNIYKHYDHLEYKTVLLKDILKNIKCPTFQIGKTESGTIPLISSSSMNNGITKYINEYSIKNDDKNKYYISIARNGSVGHCFVHNYTFGITQDVLVYELIDKNINIHILAILLTNKLSNKYNYSNKLTNDKIMSEYIDYIVN